MLMTESFPSGALAGTAAAASSAMETDADNFSERVRWCWAGCCPLRDFKIGGGTGEGETPATPRVDVLTNVWLWFVRDLVQLRLKIQPQPPKFPFRDHPFEITVYLVDPADHLKSGYVAFPLSTCSQPAPPLG